MSRATRAIVAVRALTTTFFGGSALFGILNFSPFTYFQFVGPQVVPWLAWCAAYYGGLFMALFSLTLLSLIPDLQRRSTRRLALAYVVFWGPVAIALLAYSVTDRLGPNNWSLVFAALSLLPPLWLAVIDHVARAPAVFSAELEINRPSPLPPVFLSAIGTALYVWLIYAGLAIVRPSIATSSLAVSPASAGYSLLLHLLAFAAMGWLFVTALTVARVGRRGSGVEYGLVLLIFACWIFSIWRGLLLPALAVTGPVNWVMSAAFGVVMSASWSGIAMRRAGDDHLPRSPMDLFVLPALPVRSPFSIVAWLVLMPALAYGALLLSEHLDWAFLLQKSTVLIIWLLVWTAMNRLARAATSPSFTMAVFGSIFILAGYTAIRASERRDPALDRFRRLAVLSRYAALDASFRTLDDALADRPPTPRAFYEFLQANSNVSRTVPIAPRTIELGPAIVRARVRPNIFLFAFDSMRPDYVSSYNPAVTFTPSMDALARDSLVFRKAFTRYGGTGLALPSIWSGMMQPHRQYVLPFMPMNTLLALLEGNSYRVMASLDPIMSQLLPRSPRQIELGAESVKSRDDACTVLAEVSRRLDSSGPDARATPTFAYSLGMNTHISYVQGQPILNESYPGFYAPLAARVRQIDACIGTFVDHLKTRGLYDDSVIIVTSDHGDAVGEGGRWGHGSAGYPEILRIPLIVHLPSALAARWTADTDAVSFSTDIVPTLYRLLDQEVTLHGPIVGMPLVYPPNTAAPRERRRGSFLLAGSYGPVYTLLQRNGDLLYVVDATNARDYAFDLTGGAPHSTPVPVTPDERFAYQRVIAEQVDAIAAFFHFDAQPSR